MEKNLKYWFRWIAVLPGALIAGILATFPLRWILYFSLADGRVISGVNIDPIEYNLYPFVTAITFILAGTKIAPDHKFKTAIVLSILWIISFIVIFIFISDQQLQLRGIGSILGSLLGLFIVRKIAKNE